MYARVVNRFSATRAGSWLVRNLAAKVDPRIFRATGGRFTMTGRPTLPMLALTTTGRRSGQPRTVQLAYHRDGDDYLVVASKGGAPDHPGWYKNLSAEPDIEIQVLGDVLPVRARTASAQEKARLWSVMTAEWPDYDKYQRSTPRDIPLVILSKR